MTIYDRIKQDHERLRTMMKRIAEAPASERGALFEDFKADLWGHTRIEEVVFYAPLRDNAKIRTEILEGLNEHHLSDALLDELAAMTPETETWKAKFQVLSEILQHHLEEEEESLFETSRTILSGEQADSLGRTFDERRRKFSEAVEPLARAAE